MDAARRRGDLCFGRDGQLPLEKGPGASREIVQHTLGQAGDGAAARSDDLVLSNGPSSAVGSESEISQHVWRKLISGVGLSPIPEASEGRRQDAFYDLQII